MKSFYRLKKSDCAFVSFVKSAASNKRNDICLGKFETMFPRQTIFIKGHVVSQSIDNAIKAIGVIQESHFSKQLPVQYLRKIAQE